VPFLSPRDRRTSLLRPLLLLLCLWGRNFFRGSIGNLFDNFPALDRLNRFNHLAGRLRTVAAILGQQTHHESGEWWRHMRSDLVRRGGRFRRQRRQDGQGILAVERQPARAGSVEYGPQAEQIAAAIDLLGVGLFGSHVGRRTNHRSRLGEVSVCATAARQAEIDDLDTIPARFQPDVRRLDVAMD